jgi:hypothetical protein
MTIQEAVRSLARHQAERHSQRVLLRIRETLGVGEQRYAELMESGIRQPQLGLHARIRAIWWRFFSGGWPTT